MGSEMRDGGLPQVNEAMYTCPILPRHVRILYPCMLTLYYHRYTILDASEPPSCVPVITAFHTASCCGEKCPFEASWNGCNFEASTG